MNTATSFTHVSDLASRIQPPADGTLSLTLFQDDHIKVVLFGFAAGQELSEHTASVPALLQQVQGKGRWKLGGQLLEVEPGAWVHMPAQMAHSIIADTPSVMLLTLLKSAKPASPAR